MRPVTCPTCQGYQTDTLTSRALPCGPCKGRGFIYTEGHDEWGAYRHFYHIEVTPGRLAIEDSLNEAGLGAVTPALSSWVKEHSD